jgi:4-hydroxy-4-methyl-2-oxoglutarate aldolase
MDSRISSTASALNDTGAFSTATVYEAAGQIGALPSAIKPLSNGMHVFGPALTVQCPPFDNLWLHRALYRKEAESAVLVVSVAAAYEAGYWGEILTRAALARGIAGLVIDGCVRDGSQLIELGFPVFARGLCIRGTRKSPFRGGIGESILVGDAEIHSGDLVFGDADGVVVVEAGCLDAVLERARDREAKEALIMERLDSGERTLDLYGFDEADA